MTTRSSRSPPKPARTSTSRTTWEAWASLILEDGDFLTGRPLAIAWAHHHGTLRPGQQLSPTRPFMMGGKYEISNLFAMDAIETMRFRGSLAIQTRDLPDGTLVEIKICD